MNENANQMHVGVKTTLVMVLRLLVALALAYFVIDALRSEFFGSLQYFTYTGTLVSAALLALVAGKRIGEQHLVLAVSIGTVIHVVYIVLLVGLDGIANDLRSGGLENLVLHYLAPYYLLLDLVVLSDDRRYRYRDTLLYLLVPVLYLGYVLVHGEATGEYPYFFLNVPEMGATVAIYVASIAAFFMALNLAFVAIKRRVHRIAVESAPAIRNSRD